MERLRKKEAVTEEEKDLMFMYASIDDTGSENTELQNLIKALEIRE